MMTAPMRIEPPVRPVPPPADVPPVVIGVAHMRLQHAWKGPEEKRALVRQIIRRKNKRHPGVKRGGSRS
jgi:hypothetical protein